MHQPVCSTCRCPSVGVISPSIGIDCKFSGDITCTVYVHTFSICLQLPEDFAVVYSQVQGELVVGGVFLRLFIAQPTWVSMLRCTLVYLYILN